MDSFYSYAKGALASAATLSTVAVGLVYYGQNYLIYPGHFEEFRKDIPVPSQYGIDYEQVTLTTPDKVKIKAYVILQDKEEWISIRRPTIIMFHGNGGNYGQRVPLAKIFWQVMRCNVVMLCYRGYGDSEGSASEKGFQLDSQTLLDYVASHEVLGKTEVILYGQSIGGATAIDLASRNPEKIHALILENTFTDLAPLAPVSAQRAARPWPFRVALSPEVAVRQASSLIPPTTPILFLSGRADVVVPPQHMTDLWNISLQSGRESGVWVEFPGRGHNDTCSSREYWDAVIDFVKKVTK